MESLPPREAWIEIAIYTDAVGFDYRRFPRGKRGLKYVLYSPCGLNTSVASPAGSVD